MFTLGSRRLIIRGNGRKIDVSNKLYDELIAGKHGKFSGHTHPRGYDFTPGLSDRPFLINMQQKRSGIWASTADEPYIFGRFQPEDNIILSEIRREQMRRYYKSFK